MIFYKGKELIKIDAKKGGKNKSEVDGFYKDTDGREFFIKKPSDERELFTELFAGLLLKEFMSRGLIDKIYFDSLICADLIKFDDGSYGLIQPKVSFTELYKIIGTGNNNSSDRDPLIEMIAGPNFYPTLTQQGKYFGLSISLMFSLLLGDYSVHSGNVVLRDALLNTFQQELPVKQFARIDWGAAFRNYAHKENNQDILKPYEYQGWLNFKWFTKGYIANYKNIIGLFSAIAKRATTLNDRLSTQPGSINDIVMSAFNKIPVDMLAQKTKAALADYLAIPAFATISFDQEKGYQEVAETFSMLLTIRLTKIGQLKEQAQKQFTQSDNSLNNKLSIYESIISTLIDLPPTVLTVEPSMPFPDQLSLWLGIINQGQNLNFATLNLAALSEQFNFYLEHLAYQAEIFNLWNSDSSSNINMFAPYYKGEAKAMLGHAFVAHYRESTILKRLFSLENGVTSRFMPYELPVAAYKKDNPDSLWTCVEEVLNRGYEVITCLKLLKKFQNQSDVNLNNSENIKENSILLKQALEKFVKASKLLNKQFESCSKLDNVTTSGSLFFYPISDSELNLMNGEQLVTICLEELNATAPSALIMRIIKNNALWDKVEQAYSEGSFNARIDNPQIKMASLQQWHAHFAVFQVQKENFDLIKQLDAKQASFKQLLLDYEKLPRFLQDSDDIRKVINDRVTLLIDWEKRNDSYLAHERVFLAASTSEQRVGIYKQLNEAFQALPIELQESYQIKQQNYRQQVIDIEKEITYYQCLVHYRNQQTVKACVTAFSRLKSAFEQLPESYKTNYKIDFNLLKVSNENYQQLLENQVLQGHEPIGKLQSIFNYLQAYNYNEITKETLFSDQIFWKAIISSQKETFSEQLIQDLLILKTFHQTKFNFENDKLFGQEYNQSLNLFYQKALKTRLSSMPIKQQAEAITKTAHSLFQPRHSTRRLLADALMMVGILFAGLGLAFMAGRYLTNRTVFFSNALTNREKELTKQWLVGNYDANNEQCLFSLPSISVKA
ncbi:LepB GTPase-activating domain-containing protein [Legionella sp. D16C41]|uniref:LepB GTPase-activating domain-containing protein n=1 Tax=Legionella sp. D16C41 TaxID=3402688 RepID=UPI003AF67F79